MRKSPPDTPENVDDAFSVNLTFCLLSTLSFLSSFLDFCEKVPPTPPKTLMTHSVGYKPSVCIQYFLFFHLFFGLLRKSPPDTPENVVDAFSVKFTLFLLSMLSFLSSSIHRLCEKNRSTEIVVDAFSVKFTLFLLSILSFLSSSIHRLCEKQRSPEIVV